MRRGQPPIAPRVLEYLTGHNVEFLWLTEDAHRDFIVDAEVLPHTNENTEVLPMVDRVKEGFGQNPAAVLADGLNATGPNIVGLEQ